MTYNTLIILLTGVILTLAAVPAQAQVADETGTSRLAQMYEQNGRYEEALRYYNDLLKSQPHNRNYFDGAYRCLVKLKEYDQAISLVTGRLAKFPDDPMLLVMRGAAYITADKKEQGFDDWDAAIDAQPENAAVYSSIADQAMELREYEKAIEYLEEGRDKVGTNQLFSFKIARAYSMSLQYEEAMREYLRYLAEEPSALWQVQQHISQFSKFPDALAAATRATKEAVAKNPSSVQMHHLLAWLTMETKDYETAMGVYEDLDELQQSGGRELYGFAHRAFNEQAYTVAGKAFQRVADEHPETPFALDARFFYARCMEEKNNKGEVSDDPTASFLETLGTYPNSEAIPEYQGAIQLYSELAESNPDHPVGIQSAYRIGVLRFEKFRDLDGALQQLEDIAPKYTSVTGRFDCFLLIGDIYVAQGNLDEAIKRYRKVLAKLTTEDEVSSAVKFKIAEAQYFAGKFEEAMEGLEPLTNTTNDDIANDALELKLFIQLHQMPTDAPLKRYAQAEFLAQQGKYSEAAANMKEITLLFPTSPLVDHAWLAWGLNEQRAGQAEAAKDAFEQFLKEFDDSILRDKVMFALGNLLENALNDPMNAQTMYQRILIEYPNSIYYNSARERVQQLRKGSS